MFDKWEASNFHIVRMLSITSIIPCITFYSSTMPEFVRITRSTLLLKEVLPVAKKSIRWND